MPIDGNSAWWTRSLAGMVGGAAGTAAMDLYMKVTRRAVGGQHRQQRPRTHDVSLIGRKSTRKANRQQPRSAVSLMNQ